MTKHDHKFHSKHETFTENVNKESELLPDGGSIPLFVASKFEARGGESVPDRDIPRFARFYLEGFFPIEKLIGDPYALDEVNQALTDIEHQKIGRALINIDTTMVE